jgi:hypothetical protein
MQEQMDRLRQAQDPQERQRLMQEHWASMHSAMTTMHGMQQQQWMMQPPPVAPTT